ncbi:hypothetical protein FRB95_002725 [Tulasnella sp. JGI-2019a]|nr:hypothetical protein FRB95_002725 [Tulasnella sp. JGI-2019a]
MHNIGVTLAVIVFIGIGVVCTAPILDDQCRKWKGGCLSAKEEAVVATAGSVGGALAVGTGAVAIDHRLTGENSVWSRTKNSIGGQRKLVSLDEGIGQIIRPNPAFHNSIINEGVFTAPEANFEDVLENAGQIPDHHASGPTPHSNVVAEDMRILDYIGNLRKKKFGLKKSAIDEVVQVLKGHVDDIRIPEGLHIPKGLHIPL